ncbi:MAG: hypothetical protein AAFR93_12105 [Pseudomonadota bacterium]
MFGTVKAAFAAGVLLGASAFGAHALTTTVDFSFLDSSGLSVAYGSFDYDDSQSGTLGYGDLDSFFLVVGSTVYDTAWVGQTGGANDAFGMAYDTTSQSFQTLSYTSAGVSYPYILAALEEDATAAYGYNGFFVRPEDNTPALMSYPDDFIYYSSLQIRVRSQAPGFGGTPDLVLVNPVPLPGAVWLMGAGLAALAAARRAPRAA